MNPTPTTWGSTSPNTTDWQTDRNILTSINVNTAVNVNSAVVYANGYDPRIGREETTVWT